MPSTISDSIADVVRAARTAQHLSLGELAERAGVSKAMVSKIERGESQPTAVLLAKLSGALDMTLSQLVARAEQADARLTRAEDQPTWRDPDSGYVRRAVSPAAGRPLELIDVTLPAGAEVAMPAEAYAFIHQQIWILEGRLRFIEGNDVHELGTRDCLQLGPPQPCTFVNPTTEDCRYLVALTRR